MYEQTQTTCLSTTAEMTVESHAQCTVVHVSASMGLILVDIAGTMLDRAGSQQTETTY